MAEGDDPTAGAPPKRIRKRAPTLIGMAPAAAKAPAIEAPAIEAPVIEPTTLPTDVATGSTPSAPVAAEASKAGTATAHESADEADEPPTSRVPEPEPVTSSPAAQSKAGPKATASSPSAPGPSPFVKKPFSKVGALPPKRPFPQPLAKRAAAPSRTEAATVATTTGAPASVHPPASAPAKEPAATGPAALGPAAVGPSAKDTLVEDDAPEVAPAIRPASSKDTLVDDDGPGLDLAGEATHVGEEPMSDLVGEPTNITELGGESAPVGVEDGKTSPEIESPPEVDELPFEATMPAVTAPAEPREDDYVISFADPDGAATAPIEELKVEPTVVVDPSALGRPAPTYSVDVRSGEVQLTDGGQLSEPVRPTEPGDYDADLAPKKSRLGLVIGVAAAAAIALAAGGAALWFVVLAPEETVEVAATDAPGESPTANANPPTEPEGVEATPGADPTSDSVVPDPGEAPAEGSEDDEVGADGDEGEDAEGEAGEDEDADEEGDDSASSAPGEVVPRAELEGFELALPTLARRARRMPRPQRTRTARTLRAQAIRAYRADDFAEAERLYKEAMTYETWDVAAAEGAARSIAQQRRLPEALAWANLAVERNPRSGAAYRVLGDVWRQAGHPDEAARAYRRGLARRPADRWLRQRLRDVRAER